MIRRLDRYILSEISGPLVLGFAVWTFLMLMRTVFQSADLIIQQGLPPIEVGRMLTYLMPSILVLTIPMALLFGILIAVGRLSSDTELTALRASGVSLFTLYRPILLVSLSLTALNLYLMTDVLPRSNQASSQHRIEILSKTMSTQVSPRTYQELRGHTVYVFDLPAESKGTWNGVFLAPRVPPNEDKEVDPLDVEQSITTAERGRIHVDESGEQVTLELSNVLLHSFSAKGEYRQVSKSSHEVILAESFASSERAKQLASRGVRELTLGELQDRVNDETLPEQLRNLARVEIHKKLSIPAACLVFGLFALPLGFNNRRGGKSSGFVLSLGVLMAYYVLLSNGEDAARIGKWPPWLAMWLPNLFFTALGALLLARRNRDKSLLLGRVDRWIRGRTWGQKDRSARTAAAVAEESADGRRSVALVLRLPRLRLPFPTLVDRYVMALFGAVFTIVALAGISLYLVSDLTQNLDEILRHHPPLKIILDYYKYLSLQVVYEILPLVVLVTTLLTFGLLSRTNEVNACKALGISLYRLGVPAIAASLIIFVGAFALQSEILPASNQRVAEAKDRIRGRDTARTYRNQRRWVFGQHGRYMFHYLHFDQDQQRLRRLEIFEFDDRYRISRRTFAEEADWDGERWVLDRGWTRTFDGAEGTGFEAFRDPRIGAFSESPEYFASDVKEPEQMTYGELAQYIDDLRHRGEQVQALEVQLYDKIAFPFVSIVMTLVALPFAFRLGRRGALYGVGVAVILGMVFLAVFALFTTLGETNALPAALAVWSPNLIFSAAALYMFLGIRT